MRLTRYSYVSNMLFLKQTSMFFCLFRSTISCHVSGSWHNLLHPLGTAHPLWTLQDLMETNIIYINLVFRYVFDMLSYFKPRVNKWSFLAWHQKFITVQRCHDVNVRVHGLLDAVLDKASNLRFPQGHFAKPRQGKQHMPLLTYARVANILFDAFKNFLKLVYIMYNYK